MLQFAMQGPWAKMHSSWPVSALLLGCSWHWTVRANAQEERQLKESDIFLGGSPLSDNETENQGILFRWLDELMWTDIWDSAKHREIAFGQVQQLADLAEELPSLA